MILYSMSKNPRLKFRYVDGLGDFVASTLHCKLFSWLTFIITKKTEPCGACSERSRAMNLLVPLPLWRLFFKNRQSYLKSLEKDYNNLKDVKLKSIDVVRRKQIIAESIIPPIEEGQKGYMLVSSSDTPLGDFLVRVQTFKLQ